MDYVDYRTCIKKSWENDRKSHKARLDLISNSPSNRIDNKLGNFYKQAPCRNKPIKGKKILNLLSAHQNSLKNIQKRSVSRDIVDRIQSMSGLSTLTKKFRTVDNNELYRAICVERVKSSLSLKTWEKAYEKQQTYKRQISKPHLHKKPALFKFSSPPKRNLLEIPFISF